MRKRTNRENPDVTAKFARPALRSNGRVPDLQRPLIRPLKAYAFDPSQRHNLGNLMTMEIRYQEVERGPVVRDIYARDGLAVVDYDATNNVYYDPVDLDEMRVMIRGGLDPLESDPRFHQQMVYAVATDTIQHFEAALGRRIHWRRSGLDPVDGAADTENIYTLNLFPHAMIAANAFYSPRAHGILFGYFRADESNQGGDPGQVVYTCLSHDIIVHEMTHAIVDGMRGHFMEQTNPDVAAFHEAFADVVALFRHFSHAEAVLYAIQQSSGALFQAQLSPAAAVPTGGRASIAAQTGSENPLIALAQQFGQATGQGRALRSALTTTPNSSDIKTTFECHARGAILVSAIFDAFFTIYVERTADLFRIYRSGGDASAEIPEPLARLLAEQVSQLAKVFFTVCVRAIDYCPPIDISFGDFLRAVITSDFDLHPEDDAGLCDALLQAFRVRGIVPEGSEFFTEASIAWPKATCYPPIQNLSFGNPDGLTKAQQDACRRTLQAYADDRDIRQRIGFDPDLPVNIPSFHPIFRVNQDGSLRTDMVVEATQSRQAPFDPDNPDLGTFPLRGGATLIISKPELAEARGNERNAGSTDYGLVRYVIAKHLHGDVGEKREARQRAHYLGLGLVEGSDPARFQIDFALTHGGV